MFVNLGVFRHTVISTNYSRLMGHLLTFPNFRTIGHMSVVARKWIIIIQAKYLMFPLLEQVYKQMRHLQFIVRTITWRPFPTVGPGLATSPGAGREPAQGPDHHGAHKHTHSDHRCRVTLVMSMWCLFTVLKCCSHQSRLKLFGFE